MWLFRNRECAYDSELVNRNPALQKDIDPIRELHRAYRRYAVVSDGAFRFHAAGVRDAYRRRGKFEQVWLAGDVIGRDEALGVRQTECDVELGIVIDSRHDIVVHLLCRNVAVADEHGHIFVFHSGDFSYS